METNKAAKLVGAGVAGGVLALAGISLANAATGSSQGAAQQAAPVAGYGMPAQGGDGAPTGGPGQGETPLTGETAAKVTAAAKAEVPGGTVNRVETDADGVYEAHVTKADGTEVLVQVDDSFAVTNVLEMPAGGRGGPGGPGHDEKPLTGNKAKKVRAAAEAKIPGGTVIRVETDVDGVDQAHVAKADGTEVVVSVNKAFKVTGVHEMPSPPAGAPAGARSDATTTAPGSTA